MQASNRTFICSVVFLDIVEYSRKPVAEQIQLKERLNALLADALANVAPNDRIILDTGDGAALSFLGDPEDALFVSLMLRDALAEQTTGPGMKMRIGINLGPVKLIKDLNGQPNIIGDGINVAQRIMGFAEPGQILVSRSYYEVVSCLSDGYVKLFHYEGSRTDKHVREHEVYAVQATSAALQAAHKESPPALPAPPERTVVIDRLAQTASVVVDTLRRKPRVGTAVAVIAILTLAVGLRALRAPEPAAAEVAAETPRAAASPASVVPDRVPVEERLADAGTETFSTAPAPAARPAGAERAAAEADAPPAADSPKGVVQFVILPWGEVYVDGKLLGVAPPLRQAELDPGRHRVEVRNADFPPHRQVVEVKPGSRIRITHRFR